MRYTVKEVSELSKVTVKTLHHYHEIGLLVPCAFSDAGYRLYGEEALREQDEHLNATYGYDPREERESEPIGVEAMNEQAREAATFMHAMKQALATGIKADDETVRGSIREHLAFLNAHGHAATPADFAAQTKFFLQDDFHLRMLEDQQTGLAYYLSAAAEAYANRD